jgi:hypothetical protein
LVVEGDLDATLQSTGLKAGMTQTALPGFGEASVVR